MAQVSPSLIDENALVQVSTRSLHADRLSGSAVTSASVRIETSERHGDAGMALIAQYLVQLMAEDGQVAAEIRADFAVVFVSVNGKQPERDDTQIAELSDVARLAAHPFARETIADLSRRIGLPTVLLGMLVEGEETPRSIAIGDQLLATPSSDTAVLP